uniref:Uncharacterized protein n=1 Tax=Rhizophora mucronata TaxID=61149 RepID=A0A2P2JW09_RHIMU
MCLWHRYKKNKTLHKISKVV